MSTNNEILANAKRFFGLNTDASEAEVDQKLEEAGTEDALRAHLKKELNQEFEVKIGALNTEKEVQEQKAIELASEVSTLKQELSAAYEKVKTLEQGTQEDHSGGFEEDQGGAKTPIWMSNPVNQKAAGMKFAQKTNSAK